MRAHAQNRGGVAFAQYCGQCGEARGRCRWWKQGNVFYPLLVVVVVVIVVVIVRPSLVSSYTLVANGAVSGISLVIESIRGTDRVFTSFHRILHNRVWYFELSICREGSSITVESKVITCHRRHRHRRRRRRRRQSQSAASRVSRRHFCFLSIWISFVFSRDCSYRCEW